MRKTSKSDFHPSHDIQSLQDIQTFVDRFYRRIQEDDVLGPIFEQVAGVDWEAHLDLMYQFWDSVLFATGSYKGNPLLAHQNVNQAVTRFRDKHLNQVDFARWLSLFSNTIDSLFCGPRTEQAKRSAHRMAGHLQSVCEPDFRPPTIPLIPSKFPR